MYHFYNKGSSSYGQDPVWSHTFARSYLRNLLVLGSPYEYTTQIIYVIFNNNMWLIDF